MIATLLCLATLSTDFGADLRVRQELIENVPGLPGGGVLNPSPHTDFKAHLRFRPRVWGELKAETDSGVKMRLYTRLTDEFRWYVKPSSPHPYAWPDEVVVDNLFLEFTDLFDGRMDFAIGRQDLFGLFDLDHVFVDGTPGDGSRTTFGDIARLAFKFTDTRRLDLFVLYNSDDNPLRWGTDAGKHRSMTGFGGNAEPEMDDWGFGAIWSDHLAENLPYRLFVMQKNTKAFVRGPARHPSTQRELVGLKLVPRLDEEWSLQLEAMGEVGRNGDGATLWGASSYAGVSWKSARDGIQPFGKLGYHFMSGDKDAATEDGGHGAWDPMWARGVNDSELFLYGTHYGAAWWSNMHYVKLTGGLDFGKHHQLLAHCGPLFAAAQDGLGGGDGAYKGFLAHAHYEFPLYLSQSTRFELFGHILAELFQPGDYYETDRLAWFVRWQIDFRF